MKLTKEECRKALDNVTFDNYKLGENYNLLCRLINEYFDNPPLKFEELQKGM